MSRKTPMLEAGGRVVCYYHASYHSAMERVERERDRMFEIVRRAWAGMPPEEAAQLIGATASCSPGMTFDEVLFWLCEQICEHGSGSIAAWMTRVQTLSA